MTQKRQKEIIVYSTRNCMRCKNLKKWLRRNNLSFVTKSLGDTDIMAELVMRNIFVLAAPALEIGDRVFLSDQIFREDDSLNPAFTEVLEEVKK